MNEATWARARSVVGFRTTGGSTFWPLLLFAILGCPQRTQPSIAPHLSAAPMPSPPPEGIPLSSDPDIRVVLKVPSSTPYLVEALGVGGHSVSVQLTNAGMRSADISRFRVAFTASRDGVPFPCKQSADNSVKVRPASLGPGKSFVFERDLDCTMALPGKYDVGVYVAIRDLAGARGDFVGQFPFDVLGSSTEPLPYPPRPGLYVMMTGARWSRPLSADAWARGDYHVVLSLVNGGSRPVLVGTGRLAFTTYREGSSLPCSGQAESIVLPDALAPGAVQVLHAPVTCAPSIEGQYEIVGRLALGHAGEFVQVGRVALKVTRNPVLFAPDPWLPVGGRAGSWVQ
jgi:hypothetical protein